MCFLISDRQVVLLCMTAQEPHIWNVRLVTSTLNFFPNSAFSLLLTTVPSMFQSQAMTSQGLPVPWHQAVWWLLHRAAGPNWTYRLSHAPTFRNVEWNKQRFICLNKYHYMLIYDTVDNYRPGHIETGLWGVHVAYFPVWKHSVWMPLRPLSGVLDMDQNRCWELIFSLFSLLPYRESMFLVCRYKLGRAPALKVVHTP